MAKRRYGGRRSGRGRGGASTSGGYRRTGGRGRGRRRRSRLLKAALAWAVCLVLVGLIAWGTVQGVTLLTSSKKRELRAQGQEQLAGSNYEGALASFEEALQSSGKKDSPLNRELLRLRAQAEFGLKDYEAVLHTCELLEQMDGKSAGLSYWRSICLAKSGDAAGALSAYNEGVAEDSDPAGNGRLEALMAVGPALAKAGTYDQAMALYQAVLNEGADHAQIYNQMGLCQMAAERYEDALDSFGKGIDAAAGEEQPDGETLKELTYNQAAATEYTHDYKRALELFEAYVEQFGEDERARHEIDFLKTR